MTRDEYSEIVEEIIHGASRMKKEFGEHEYTTSVRMSTSSLSSALFISNYLHCFAYGNEKKARANFLPVGEYNCKVVIDDTVPHGKAHITYELQI